MNPFSITDRLAAKILWPLCVLITSGIVFCTLWPFDFVRSNQVSWLEQTNGIRVRQLGVVLGPQVPAPASPDPARKPCTFEVWIKPTQTNAVGTIVNVYVPGNPHRFSLRQYLVGLIISHDVQRPWRAPTRIKVDVDDGLKKNQPLFITITSGQNGTAVYFNGNLRKSFPWFQLSTDDLTGQVTLGSSAVMPDAWSGEIRGLAFYPQQLTPEQVLANYRAWVNVSAEHPGAAVQPNSMYSFSERRGNIIHDRGRDAVNLSVPRTYKVPHHTFLTPPWLEFDPSWDYFWDVVRNIVGFMPFGFIVCGLFSLSVRGYRAVIYTALIGCGFSLCVEVVQAYIPQRSSGFTDIITNTLGTLVGAVLLRLLYEILPASSKCGVEKVSVSNPQGNAMRSPTVQN